MVAGEFYYCRVCGERRVKRRNMMCAFCRGRKGGSVRARRDQIRGAKSPADDQPGGEVEEAIPDSDLSAGADPP